MTTAPRFAAATVALALGGALLAGCASSSPAATTSAASSTSKAATSSAPASSTTTKTSAPATTPTVAVTTPAASGYTLDAVKQHNTASSCWSVINKNVYDLTAWINAHPGGAQRIKSICGIDGTSEFQGAHGGDNGPASRLASFKLGPLA